ncbi:MAG: hypothetical protein AB1782_12670 [Cyanobacteriota bacterium]
MEGLEAVKNFFSSMHCSKCHNLLKPDGITLLREESNFYVVKIICIDCNQPVGLAIVGIQPREPKEYTIEKEDYIEKGPDNNAPPITYDDVIDAHQFFSNLGSDWSKHINNIKDSGTE